MTDFKRIELRAVLTALFAVVMVVSNVVTTKQVALPFGLSVTGGVFVFPIAYVLSDVFSECYGYRWSRITCHVALMATAFTSLVFWASIAAPPSPFWDGQESFALTLGNTPNVFLASLAAYFVGDYVNDRVFAAMMGRGSTFWVRAISSSVVGEVADSLVFYPVALLGMLSPTEVVVTALSEVIMKLAIEVLVMPVTNIVVRAIGHD